MDSAGRRWVVRDQEVDLTRPLLMGIVNASPDSFSDGRDHVDTEARVARAVELVDQGAGIVDVGGESAITGVPPVDVDEELARVVPVVAGILAERPDALVSVDTYKPPVAAAVLDVGAALINDVSGLQQPELAALCAKAGAGLVVMHTRSRPKQRRAEPELYDDVTGDVVELLGAKLAEAEAHGLPRESVLLDPGPDFAKTPHQTVTVLRKIDKVRALGRPLLLALSRKDFVGAITWRRPRQRLAGTLAAIGHVIHDDPSGLVLRVHDVAEVVDYLRVAAVLSGDEDIPADLELPMDLRREPSPRQ